MSLGLHNALARFQEYINKIFAEKLDILVIFHFDDIVVYIENSS